MAQLLLILLAIPTVLIPLFLAFSAFTRRNLIMSVLFLISGLVAGFLLLASDPEKAIFAIALMVSSASAIASLAENKYLSLFQKYLIYIPVAAFNSGLGVMLLIERSGYQMAGTSGDRIGLLVGALVFIICSAFIGRKKKFL
jgi:hypothetical protein